MWGRVRARRLGRVAGGEKRGCLRLFLYYPLVVQTDTVVRAVRGVRRAESGELSSPRHPKRY